MGCQKGWIWWRDVCWCCVSGVCVLQAIAVWCFSAAVSTMQDWNRHRDIARDMRLGTTISSSSHWTAEWTCINSTFSYTQGRSDVFLKWLITRLWFFWWGWDGLWLPYRQFWRWGWWRSSSSAFMTFVTFITIEYTFNVEKQYEGPVKSIQESVFNVLLQTCIQIQNLPMKLLSKGKFCGQKDGGLSVSFLGSSSLHLLLWRRVLALLFWNQIWE